MSRIYKCHECEIRAICPFMVFVMESCLEMKTALDLAQDFQDVVQILQ